MKGELEKGKVRQVTDYLRYSIYLKDKSIAEKKMIICQAKNPSLVELFLTEPEDIIDCYAIIYQNDETKFLDILYRILLKSNDDYLKCKYIPSLTDENKKMTIILSINDLYLRGCVLQYLNIDNQQKIVKTITDNEILKQVYFKTYNLEVLCAITDDDFKNSCLPCWDLTSQAKIITTFERDELKYFYACRPEFADYFVELTLSFKDIKYKSEMFYQCQNEEDKLLVIDQTDDLNEFNYLLSLLPPSFCKSVFELSRVQNKTNIMKCMKLNEKELGRNSDLTFKLSFEVDTNFCPDLSKFEKLLNNWLVVRNPYYPNLVKITSPKLKYSEEGFKEVKIILDLLKNNHCYPYISSTMKIKFNFDYFKTAGEFINFIKLYTYAEPLLNNICNKAGNGFAKGKTIPFRCLLDYLSKCDNDFYLDGDLSKIVKKINDFTTSENYSLNLLDCLTEEGMLEFRMADIELDFNELSKTIMLFAKLLEKAKLISNLDRKNLAIDTNNRHDAFIANRNLLINCLKEKKNLLEIYKVLNNLTIHEIVNSYPLGKENNPENNLEGLLKILFDYEIIRQKYRERYQTNTQVTGQVK